ncbi:MAG: aminotransferase class III-fold pyridoxal phosphate-dependent enzyme [Nitrospirae bacterium]|nr:aminotransferase class III-fold pyridoxal phosphate-dependent enzyme [Candidatus Manganitrophaceae bacterium]
MPRAVVVQARNGSSRYPRKMLHPLLGRPALEWVFDRCEKIAENNTHITIDQRILATTEEKEDDPLAEIAQRRGWQVIRGSVEDVLGRFAKAVRAYRLDTVVRITGDCLLTDPRLIEHALTQFDLLKPDYLLLTKIIDGFDIEVMTGKAILKADSEAKVPSEREHVGPYLRRSKQFNTVLLPYGEEDLSHIHLSLDYREDAEVLESIIKQLGSDFTYTDVAKLIKAHPQLIEKTKHIIPNEGYRRSLEGDKAAILGMKGKPLRLEKSLSQFEKVMQIIPTGSQTFSKSHLQFSVGAAPLFVREGKGAFLTDLDGNRFIDFTMGLGACLLGYAFEPVNREMEATLRKGSTYTLPHHLEYDLAELLTQVIPSAEMVRFGKNGSDVTSAAVRLARAATGREVIACCGDHGWQDWYIATTTRSLGIPEEVKKKTITFQYNQIESLQGCFDRYPNQIAGVILEPVSLEAPQKNFLSKVKKLAEQKGAVLIFDEVVTGFRFDIGGAQAYFGVTPDLTCVGKAMANGMPVSAIVGKRDLMKLLDEIFFSFTFGGETLSLAAALATIHYLLEQKVTPFLWKQGEKLKEGIGRQIREKGLEGVLSIDGYPIRTVLGFKGEEKEVLKMKTLFQQECVKRGILFTGGHNISLPHDQEKIERLLSVYDEVMEILKYTLEYQMLDEMLEGRPLEPVFRKV